MPVVSTPKHQVAIELLEAALRTYVEGKSYYAALHLAGGAEEVLSVYARSMHIQAGEPMVPAYDSFKNAVVALSGPTSEQERHAEHKAIADLMNRAMNSVKHKYGIDDEFVSFDAKEESAEVIDRAVTTYFQMQASLTLPHLPLIAEFDASRRKRTG